MNIYQIRNLTKQYAHAKQFANRDINLDIEQGEIFGLLGANGAGKSTLVKQMVNLLTPTSGEVVFAEGRVNSAEMPLYIGYMPQKAQALNRLTVSEALYYCAHLRGLSSAEAQRERDRLIELWQLEPFRNQDSDSLSGGQKRLLRLAVSMAGNPPVLILDEPTNDLDPRRRKLVWDILRDLNQANGTTIIFITHDAIEAEKIIERVGIMSGGELIALGRPGELKKQIANELHLDLYFDPQLPPTLPADIRPIARAAGHWHVLLPPERAATLLTQLDLEQLDDFRLSSPTLEDLYLHYVSLEDTP